MSVRGGGRPRDEHSQAHPYEPGYDPATGHDRARLEGQRRRRAIARDARRSSRGSGLRGLLRFAIFVVVLAGAVLVVLSTALRPLMADVIVDLAFDNPGALRIGFVADLVREDLGAALTDPASADPTEVEFVVQAGDTPAALAPRLREDGLIASERAFLFVAAQTELAGKLDAGRFLLRRDMTPAQVVTALVEARIVAPPITPVTFREGLRLEQMTAKLLTLTTRIDVEAFYEEVKHPPAELLAAYPWLEAAGLPKGASLEGFLYPATYPVRTTTTADDLVRMMLDTFHERVGPERLEVPEERGLSFYEVLSLASIVEREAVLPEERALIAGVYQNRLDKRPRLLDADPTVIYAVDTVKLADLPFGDWQTYFFWGVPETKMQDVALPKTLQGYQTYQSPGLIPGPICSPTAESIDAAVRPDTKSGYFYFVAIPDESGKHAFAKTLKEHQENLRKYGYQ